MATTVHRSVLMQEVLDGLDLSPSDVVVDATVNGGGHAEKITEQLSDTGVFIGIDLDSSAIEVSSARLKNTQCQVELVNDSFKNIDTILHNLELKSRTAKHHPAGGQGGARSEATDLADPSMARLMGTCFPLT